MSTPQTKKIAWVLLLGLVCGIVGETLLFMQRQCQQLESMMLDDFRVLAFLHSEVTDLHAKVIEEKVRALTGVKEVRYVSRESALASLQEQDPELVRSVALLGENPLHAGFEIRLFPEAIVQMPSWLQSASEVHELADIHYKPLQITAIMQLQFYNQFLNLALSLAAFVWLISAIASFWVVVSRPEIRDAFQEVIPSLGASGLGTLAGMGLIFFAAYPLRSLGEMWVWPSMNNHALLLLVGMLGGGLLPEVKAANYRLKERHGPMSHSSEKEKADESTDSEGAVEAGR